MRNSTGSSSIPALIVGAVPTGLVLALWLRRKGIQVRIIDKNSGPGKTSRALAVQARTLEFYQQLGIAQEVISEGVTAQEIVMRRSGKEIARAFLGALGKEMSPFPYLLFYAQDLHETLLERKLKELGVVVERQTELASFHQDERAVYATLKTLRGEEKIEAQYLCGCDGAHSLVRHGLDTSFAGGTYSQIFFVADVVVENEKVEETVQISLSPTDFCIILPIRARGTVRLTGIVPPESEYKKEVSYEDVAESVKNNSGLSVKKVNWFSSYQVHHRVADHFRRGRVFLAGDAGHIHSPAGGQGMNTGIGDAINLAWKLAEVLNGRFDEKLLATYEPERKAFAQVLVSTTDAVFRFVASRSLLGSYFRAFFLPRFFTTLTRFDFFLRFAFRTVSQIRIRYPQSQLSEGQAGSLHAGDRLPWVVSDGKDNFLALSTLDWQVQIYGPAREEFRQGLKVLGLPFEEFSYGPQAQKKGFKEGGAYLVRPDGHLGLILEGQNLEKLRGYWQKIGGQTRR